MFIDYETWNDEEIQAKKKERKELDAKYKELTDKNNRISDGLRNVLGDIDNRVVPAVKDAKKSGEEVKEKVEKTGETVEKTKEGVDKTVKNTAPEEKPKTMNESLLSSLLGKDTEAGKFFSGIGDKSVELAGSMSAGIATAVSGFKMPEGGVNFKDRALEFFGGGSEGSVPILPETNSQHVSKAVKEPQQPMPLDMSNGHAPNIMDILQSSSPGYQQGSPQDQNKTSLNSVEDVVLTTYSALNDKMDVLGGALGGANRIYPAQNYQNFNIPDARAMA